METMAQHNATTNASEPISPVNILNVFYWEQILTAILIGLIAITGLIGNSMIIAAVAFSKKLQTPTNAFVTSLAVADVLTSFTLIWFIVGALGNEDWPIPNAYWICQFTGFMIYACIAASMWTLGAVAVNRLVHIVRPKWYSKIFASWKLCVLVLIPWIVPGLGLMILSITGHANFGYNKLTMVCAISTNTAESAYAVNIIGLLFPLPAILISYIWIYVYIKKHFHSQRQKLKWLPDISMTENPPGRINSMSGFQSIKRGRKDSNPARQLNRSCSLVRRRSHILHQQIEITKNLFFIVCGFFACFLPYFILTLFRNSVDVEHVIFYLKVGPLASSAMNFVIYASQHPDFKIVLRHMMRCSYADIPQPSPFLKYLLTKKN